MLILLLMLLMLLLMLLMLLLVLLLILMLILLMLLLMLLMLVLMLLIIRILILVNLQTMQQRRQKMKLFKLTDQQGYTQKELFGETKWREGFTLSLPPVEDPQLCTAQVIHAYKNLNLGLLLNPAQANIQNPLIWECEGNVCIEDWGKVGVFSLTTIQKVEPPKWFLSNTEKKRVAVKFAVACAKAVLPIFEDKFPKDLRPRKAIEAAKKYLRNKNAYTAADATYTAANAAYAAADAYATNATNAAATYAANTAYAAANAAAAATTYAAAATTDAAAAAAAYAAYAAAYAAADAYAANAANAATTAANYKNINFGKLADNAT